MKYLWYITTHNGTMKKTLEFPFLLKFLNILYVYSASPEANIYISIYCVCG